MCHFSGEVAEKELHTWLTQRREAGTNVIFYYFNKWFPFILTTSLIRSQFCNIKKVICWWMILEIINKKRSHIFSHCNDCLRRWHQKPFRHRGHNRQTGIYTRTGSVPDSDECKYWYRSRNCESKGSIRQDLWTGTVDYTRPVSGLRGLATRVCCACGDWLVREPKEPNHRESAEIGL